MIEVIAGVLGTAILGLFAWGVAINSKVNVLESEMGNKTNTQNQKVDALATLVTYRFDDMGQRLARIERYVLNGHYKDSEV